MRMMKKIAMLMLAVCLVVPCFSFLSQAANGKIMFTDHTNPAVETGTTVEVKGVVNKTNNTMGKIEITMTYDATMLKFKSGDGITEVSAGTIKYVGDATRETGNRKEFKMTFEALKAGNATIQISEAVVKNVSGAVMDYTKGTSTIKITGDDVVTQAEPTDVSESTVEVEGKNYHISNEIPKDQIPEGYETATLDYDLVEYNVVYSEDFDLYLAYLVGEDKVGDFFMYVDETATFVPYEAIEISDKTTIVLLSDVSDVVLPEEYKKISVPSAKGFEFPAWQLDDAQGFCILYALNNNGEEGLYQFDNAEGTYQRFVAPEVIDESGNKSFIGTLSKLLENHLDYVILGAGFGFLLFVIIIVVLSVKLYNRNAELDEIYDEYGLDDEDEETEDDIILALDDDEEDNVEEEYEEYEVETFVQAGMKELFPEEVEETVEEEEVESIDRVAESIIEQETEIDEEESTLGAILAQQRTAEQDEPKSVLEETTPEEEEDDILMEDFAMDFIDLDD